MRIGHIGGMTISGHRGDCYNYYENTMTAFKKALESGADMIETDVRITKDGVLEYVHNNYEKIYDSRLLPVRHDDKYQSKSG